MNLLCNSGNFWSLSLILFLICRVGGSVDVTAVDVGIGAGVEAEGQAEADGEVDAKEEQQHARHLVPVRHSPQVDEEVQPAKQHCKNFF